MATHTVTLTAEQETALAAAVDGINAVRATQKQAALSVDDYLASVLNTHATQWVLDFRNASVKTSWATAPDATKNQVASVLGVSATALTTKFQ